MFEQKTSKKLFKSPFNNSLKCDEVDKKSKTHFFTKGKPRLEQQEVQFNYITFHDYHNLINLYEIAIIMSL